MVVRNIIPFEFLLGYHLINLRNGYRRIYPFQDYDIEQMTEKQEQKNLFKKSKNTFQMNNVLNLHFMMRLVNWCLKIILNWIFRNSYFEGD